MDEEIYIGETDMSYRDKVREAISRRDGTPLFNGSDVHASIIVEEMFLSAEQSMLLLVNSLAERIYGTPDMIRAATAFMERGGKLRILVEDGNRFKLDQHPLMCELLPKYRNQIEVALVEQKLAGDQVFNFAVVDDDGYRFEEDRNQVKAVVVFGDKKGAGILESMFEAFRRTATVLHAPRPDAMA